MCNSEQMIADRWQMIPVVYRTVAVFPWDFIGLLDVFIKCSHVNISLLCLLNGCSSGMQTMHYLHTTQVQKNQVMNVHVLMLHYNVSIKETLLSRVTFIKVLICNRGQVR